MENTFLGLESGFKGAPHSYWIDSTPTTDYPALEDDISTDVAIVGGGLVGIVSAYLLKKEGYKVVVLDADRIVQGTTGHTTAKITSQHGLVYTKIKTKLSEELARQYADANEAAIHAAADIIEQNNIDCDFTWQPAYVYTMQDSYVQKIEDEVRLAKSFGIKAEYLDDIPLPLNVKAAERFDGQAQFHPRKYVLALAKQIPEAGCYIFENTRVMDLEKGDIVTLITEKGPKIRAKYVIAASHFPFYDGGSLYFSRLYPIRSYVVAVKPKQKYPGGMYMSAEEPGRSLRYQPYGNEQMILYSGEHHETGQGENMNSHYNNLKKFAEDTLGIDEILYRWSTHDYETPDRAPYIGKLNSDTPNIFMASGFYKWGMTNSHVAAMIFKDLIIKGENPWTEVYNPQRINPAGSAKMFIKENADVAKHLIKGKLKLPESSGDIKNGEAKTIEIDGKKYGAYRDEKGSLHVVDTTCPHLGCEVNWNDAEKTWDCPCHGSRYTYEGDIVEGPSVHPLNHVEDGPNEIDPNIR